LKVYQGSGSQWRLRNVKVCQGTAATKNAKMHGKAKREKIEKPSERSCG